MTTKPVAVVTGSGKRRLGRHIAEALAARGYSLALHYNSSASEAAEAVADLRKRGVEASAFQANLAQDEAARGLVQATLDEFGRIDLLVNSAAIWRAKSFDQVTAQDVRQHFEANVLGTFLCSQHAGLAMVRQPQGGCIVNFGDWAEVRPYSNYAAYFATKGAIPVLTRCLAVELGTRNPRIRVNCILPGPVLFQPDLPEAQRQEVIQATLVRHEGRPENVAQTVLFFVDNEFITGACLPVDGGRTIFANDN